MTLFFPVMPHKMWKEATPHLSFNIYFDKNNEDVAPVFYILAIWLEKSPTITERTFLSEGFRVYLTPI